MTPYGAELVETVARAREAKRLGTVVCRAFGHAAVCPLKVPCRQKNGCGYAHTKAMLAQIQREIGE